MNFMSLTLERQVFDSLNFLHNHLCQPDSLDMAYDET